tara:strand:+ start:638 stop:1072 length:435 start_codon:yes stop_codon:yes gene_type:complete
MKGTYLYPQPPIAEKYSFLVDQLDKNHCLGITTDWNKIEYNLKMMGANFNQRLEIGLSFLEKGITETIDVGRYIAVVGINKNKSEGIIRFFDSRLKIERNELYKEIELMYDKIIAKSFILLYDMLLSNSSSFKDNVELLLVVEE